MASGVRSVIDTGDTPTIQLGEYGYNSYFSREEGTHFRTCTAQFV